MSGTLAPVPVQQFFDHQGAPVAGGWLYSYAAGTTSPLTIYADVNLVAAHSNPAELDGAGRLAYFLGPYSYKFTLCTAEGVELWTQDNVTATASYAVDLDIDGVAGESLTAGQAVFLSDGTGGLTAGRWYLTDADVAAKSSLANMVGMVPSTIAAGTTGGIRLQGRVTGLTGLSAGSSYYVSATAGAITATAPANVRLVGVADSTTSLVLFGAAVGNVTTGLLFTPLKTGDGLTENDIIATINLSSELDGALALRIASNKIRIDGEVAFTSGYDPTEMLPITTWSATKRRDDTPVVAPVIPVGTGTVDASLNTNGSADISFEWTWAGNEPDIDGFQFFIFDGGTGTPAALYSFNLADLTGVAVLNVPASNRAFILQGAAQDHYYTYGVRAYRLVDLDIDASGMVTSALTQTIDNTYGGEMVHGAFRPSSSPFFNSIGQTIGGQAYTAFQNSEITIGSIGGIAIGGAEADITTISGSKVRTGTISSTNWGASAGSEIDLVNGYIRFGGSSSPKLYWNGSTLTISGTITASTINGSTINAGTAGTIKLDSTGLQIDPTDTGGTQDTAKALSWKTLTKGGSMWLQGIESGATRTLEIQNRTGAGNSARIYLWAYGDGADSTTKLTYLDLVGGTAPKISLSTTEIVFGGTTTPTTVRPNTQSTTTLGHKDYKFKNIHLDIPAASSPGYVVAAANATTDGHLGYIYGYTGTVTGTFTYNRTNAPLGSGAATTLTFVQGVLTTVT